MARVLPWAVLTAMVCVATCAPGRGTWLTTGGNYQRSGYVDATIGTVQPVQQWSKQVGYSNFVFANNHIYSTLFYGQTTCYLMVQSQTTGEYITNVSLGATGTCGQPTLHLESNTVFVPARIVLSKHSIRTHVHAVSTTTHTPRWVGVSALYTSVDGDDYGSVCSDDTYFLPIFALGGVARFRIATGEYLGVFQTPGDAGDWGATLTPSSYGNQQLVFASNPPGVVGGGVLAATGRKVWSYTSNITKNYRDYETAWFPVVAGNFIVLAPWEMIGDNQYSFYTAVDFTGRKQWVFKCPSPGSNYQQPVSDGKSVFIPCPQDALYELSLQTGELIRKFKDSDYGSSQLITNDYVFLGPVDDGHIRIFRRSDGEIVGRIQTLQDVSTMAYDGGWLFFQATVLTAVKLTVG
jgi:hypothetical protein